MADREHAAMDRDQAPSAEAAIDRSATDTQRGELRARHDAVLSGGQRPDHCVGDRGARSPSIERKRAASTAIGQWWRPARDGSPRNRDQHCGENAGGRAAAFARSSARGDMPTPGIQPHVRLQEWVAEDEGFFREERLDYEFVPRGLCRGTGSAAFVSPASWRPQQSCSGAFRGVRRLAGPVSVGRGLPLGHHHAPPRGPRQHVGQGLLGVRDRHPCAAESPYIRPEDLAGVAVGVGYHSALATRRSRGWSHSSTDQLQIVGYPFAR